MRLLPFALALLLALPGVGRSDTSGACKQTPNVLCLAGRSGGQTVSFDTASAGVGTIRATAHAVPGTLSIVGQLNVGGNDGTLYNGILMDTTFTNTGVSGDYWSGISFQGTISQTSATAQSAKFFIVGDAFTNDQMIWSQSAGSVMSAANGFVYRATIRSDGATLTSGQNNAFVDEARYDRVNSGTMAGITHISWLSQGTTVGAGITMALRYGQQYRDAAGAGSLTTQAALHVDDLTKATTNMSFQSDGTAVQMRHAGPVMIGSGGSSQSPGTTQLYVWQNTLGNEVFRATSTATNDDPRYSLYQSRVATTNATQTAFGNNVAVASGQVSMVEARVIARCTTGSACTTNQSASYVRRIVCKNDAGTTAAVGAVQTVGTDQESTAGWDITMDCDNTTDTARALVTGAANTTITWHVTYEVQDVGS